MTKFLFLFKIYRNWGYCFILQVVITIKRQATPIARVAVNNTLHHQHLQLNCCQASRQVCCQREWEAHPKTSWLLFTNHSRSLGIKTFLVPETTMDTILPRCNTHTRPPQQLELLRAFGSMWWVQNWVRQQHRQPLVVAPASKRFSGAMPSNCSTLRSFNTRLVHTVESTSLIGLVL